jgi:hypothetical protein
MRRPIATLLALLVTTGCSRDTGTNSENTDTSDWWNDNGSGDTSPDPDGDDEDRSDKDDDEPYAELILLADEAPTTRFSGVLGVEGFDGTTACLAFFATEGVATDPCPGCTTTLAFTLGDTVETEGDCSALPSLPVSAPGQTLVLGWASEDRVQLQTTAGWSPHWAESGTEDGEWYLFVDLLDEGHPDDDG